MHRTRLGVIRRLCTSGWQIPARRWKSFSSQRPDPFLAYPFQTLIFHHQTGHCDPPFVLRQGRSCCTDDLEDTGYRSGFLQENSLYWGVRFPILWGEDFLLPGGRGCFQAGMNIQFCQNGRNMVIHCFQCDGQLPGNLRIAQALDQQSQDLHFTRGQPFRVGPGGRPAVPSEALSRPQGAFVHAALLQQAGPPTARRSPAPGSEPPGSPADNAMACS